MIRSVLAASILSLALLLGAPARGAPGDQPLEQGYDACSHPGMKAFPQAARPFGSILEFLQARDPNYTHIIDGYFLFDARRQANALTVTAFGMDPNSPQGKTDVNEVSSLFGLLNPNDPSSPATFKDYLAALRSNAGSMSMNARLLYLSVLGSRLSGNYDDNVPDGATPLEQLYQSLRGKGSNGGVCRDIHAFLAQAAAALGFDDVGVHTGLWKLSDSETGAHAIAHFRDRQTGEYYTINYGMITNTHQKTLTEAIDVSTRILGPLTGTSFVESKPGIVHAYVPRTARWLKQVIDNQADIKPGQALVNYQLGNIENSVGINLSEQVGPAGVKAFGTVADYKTPEGHFRVEAIGATARLGQDLKLQARYLDEIGYAVQGSGGMLRLTVPRIPGSGPDGSDTRQNYFWQVNAKGYARFNKITGKIEFEGRSLDLSSAANDSSTHEYLAGTASVAYQPTDWFKTQWERRIENAPRTIQDYSSTFRPVSAHDKISVIFDAKAGQVYLYNRGEFYLFRGLEHTDAVGVRNYFRATLPTDKWGSFSVFADISKVVANPSGDPYYQSNLHAVAGIDWTKPIIKNYLELGGRVEYDATGKNPYYAFEDPGKVTPELERVPGVTGMVWLHGSL